ncbi:hypothetical protein Hanom_Chr01g00055611 [Helianthus anomalus]
MDDSDESPVNGNDGGINGYFENSQDISAPGKGNVNQLNGGGVSQSFPYHESLTTNNNNINNNNNNIKDNNKECHKWGGSFKFSLENINGCDGAHSRSHVGYGDKGSKVRAQKMSYKNNPPKMLSKDERPNPPKRQRLDFDPVGLDIFGLDVLLGISKPNQVTESDGIQEVEKEDLVMKDTPTDKEVPTVTEVMDKGLDLNSQPERSGHMGRS